MSSVTILTICGDPGGANAILPVICLLKKENRISLINFAYHEALIILQKSGISSTVLSGEASLDKARKFLKKNSPILLLSATSNNTLNWENYFILAAKELNIFSITILDFWSNYALRFSDKEGKLIYLPNKIVVMDERAEKEAIEEGIPSELLLVAGQPAFDALYDFRLSFSSERKMAIRADLNIKDNGLLVMFASQPIRRFYKELNKINPLGYDEVSVLNEVIKSLELLSIQYDQSITLLIRPHPREKAIDYAKFTSKDIQIVTKTEGESRYFLLSSDVVVGMTTALLVEACYLNCIVLSVQAGLVQKDSLPTNAWGVSHAVYKTNEITPALASLLFDVNKRHNMIEKTNTLLPQRNTTRKIVDYLYGITIC